MRYDPEIISKNIKRNQKIKKGLFIVLYLLLIPTILFSIFLMFVELGNSDEVPSFFDMDIYIVVSESMAPKINVNDIVLVKKGYTNEQYKVGNIITYVRADGEIITHRIEEITKVGLLRAYVTKGDNNEKSDEYTVNYEQIIGKVVYVMPKFGAIVNLLKNKLFFAFCIIFLIFIVIYDRYNRNKILQRKKTREKYDKKSSFYF